MNRTLYLVAIFHFPCSHGVHLLGLYLIIVRRTIPLRRKVLYGMATVSCGMGKFINSFLHKLNLLISTESDFWFGPFGRVDCF